MYVSQYRKGGKPVLAAEEKKAAKGKGKSTDVERSGKVNLLRCERLKVYEYVCRRCS